MLVMYLCKLPFNFVFVTNSSTRANLVGAIRERTLVKLINYNC